MLLPLVFWDFCSMRPALSPSLRFEARVSEDWAQQRTEVGKREFLAGRYL